MAAKGIDDNSECWLTNAQVQAPLVKPKVWCCFYFVCVSYPIAFIGESYGNVEMNLNKVGFDFSFWRLTLLQWQADLQKQKKILENAVEQVSRDDQVLLRNAEAVRCLLRQFFPPKLLHYDFFMLFLLSILKMDCNFNCPLHREKNMRDRICGYSMGSLFLRSLLSFLD
jgi:hypothetical protein